MPLHSPLNHLNKHFSYLAPAIQYLNTFPHPLNHILKSFLIHLHHSDHRRTSLKERT